MYEHVEKYNSNGKNIQDKMEAKSFDILVLFVTFENMYSL